MEYVEVYERPVVLDTFFRSALALLADAVKGRQSALSRMQRAFGAESKQSVDLRAACDCIAIEWRYEDWDSMKRDASSWAAGEDARRWTTMHAFTGINSPVQGQSKKWREDLNSLGVRLALLDVNESDNQINEAAVNEPLTPLYVAPLVYLCCSTFGNEYEVLKSLRRRLVDQLLDKGANPNAGMCEQTSIRGYRTCLSGAIGCARDAKLAKRLLDAGADIADGPTLYEGSAMWEAIRWRDLEALDVLIAADPPEWHLCHALTHSLQFHDFALVERLLASGANPNWDKTVFGMGGNALHEAIHCGVAVSTLEALLDGGAKLDATDEGDRTPLAVATAFGRTDFVNVLLTYGADRHAVGVFERFVGACFQERESEAMQLLDKVTETHSITYHDNLWLHEAMKHGSRNALNLLLKAPLDANVLDYQGETALHRAVLADDAWALRRLLDLGGDVRNQNFDGDTVVELAIRHATTSSNGRVLDALAAYVTDAEFSTRGSRLSNNDISAFERAADAIAAGDEPTLRELLKSHPHFKSARSQRPHRCTLMNYIGVNGFESERQKTPSNAVQIIELLLEQGCDPNAVCYTYRGGPGETTLGLLLSSGVVESPQQQIAMVRALVKGGAKIDPGYQVLFELLDAQDAGSVDQVVADLNMTDGSVVEAFIALAKTQELAVMQSLLDAGLDVNAVNHLKQTALHWAAFEGHESVVDWLIERGADPTLRELQFNGTGAGWADAGGYAELASKLARLERVGSS